MKSNYRPQINAMLTGGDSTRSSTAGRPSPPLRDPMQAAQDWRNLEESAHQGRGTLRRRRPGVTFDVGEEVPEDGRPSLQKSMRANMAAMAAQAQQAQQPPQTQQPQSVQPQQAQTYSTHTHHVQPQAYSNHHGHGQLGHSRQATA